MLSILIKLLLRAGEGIEQLQLFLRREQRLVIVRPVKIDQFVPELFQDRQCGGRAVDELAVGAAAGKRALENQLALASFDAGFDQLRIQLLQVRSGENCFDCAHFRSCADEGFVRPFAEQKLQCADDDRFARAGFAGDSDEPAGHLPFELFDEREIFYAQQVENGRHAEG